MDALDMSLRELLATSEGAEQLVAAISAERVLDDDPRVLAADVDVLWFILGGILVFLMQAGFAMLEVGMVSVKNTKNILVKNLFDASLGALCWWAVGWGFSYGTLDATPTHFIGNSQFFGDMPDSDKEDWFFQWAFAATAATIVSGAVAERVSFGCYLVYSVALTSFIYPVVVSAGWATGGFAYANSDFFNGCFTDFAGSAIVHLTGGVAAFVAAIIVGPRIGRFDGTGVPLPQQSVIFQTLGTLILWFGWYGFNGASTLGISGQGLTLAHVCMTTTLAAASGCIGTVSLTYYMTGVIDIGAANNGILAGLVGITAGCAVVENIGAILIGFFAAPVYFFSSRLLEKLHIDDVVGAAPIHMFCGMYGAVVVGLFASKSRAGDCAGVFYGGNADTLFANFVFCLFVIGWTGGLIAILFMICKFTIGVRVSKEIEEAGMDDSKHGGKVFDVTTLKMAPEV
jgi:Amt family ammonium transporter